MHRLSFLVILVAGCTSSGGGDDTGDDAPAIDADPGGGTAEPRTGEWRYDEYAVAGGDCDVASELNADGDFGLVNDGDGRFTITPGDGTDPFECTLDGADFACPDRATAEYSEGGIDATLQGTARADGTFSDDETGEGEQTVEVSCAGGDCAAVEAALGVDFPCTFVADFGIAWRNP